MPARRGAWGRASSTSSSIVAARISRWTGDRTALVRCLAPVNDLTGTAAHTSVMAPELPPGGVAQAAQFAPAQNGGGVHDDLRQCLAVLDGGHQGLRQGDAGIDGNDLGHVGVV